MTKKIPIFVRGSIYAPDPPCETFACRHFKTCMEHETSCEAFHIYVESGVSHSPEPIRYRSGFGYMTNLILPTKAWYKHTFNRKHSAQFVAVMNKAKLRSTSGI